MREGSDGAEHQLWTPCPPGAPGGMQMSLMDIPSDELLAPDVLPSDFQAAIDKVRPSVSPSDLRQFEAWTKMYGMEGVSDSSETPRKWPLEKVPGMDQLQT